MGVNFQDEALATRGGGIKQRLALEPRSANPLPYQVSNIPEPRLRDHEIRRLAGKAHR